MSTQNIDLESQEQIANLKHFWDRYGNWIAGAAVAAALAFFAWDQYDRWQAKQAGQASVLYTAVETAAAQNDSKRLQQAFADIRSRYPETAYAAQAALLTGRALGSSSDVKDVKAAEDALAWLAQNGKHGAYRSLAAFRAAGLAYERKSYEDALRYLSARVEPNFIGLMADRRGDVYMAQNKPELAKNEYAIAYKQLSQDAQYRQLVAAKLNSLGFDPTNEKK